MKKGFTSMIYKYFNGDVREKLQLKAEQIGLKSQQAIDVITLTKNTVKEVLHAELKSGNYNQVISFLQSSAVKAGRDLIKDKIMQRVVGRLILRFGLPQGIALNIATILVPFILKRIGKKALKSGKVQDFLNSVGVKEKIEKFDILKIQLKDKFSFGNNAAA